MFFDLVLIATMSRATWELAMRRVIPTSIFVVSTVGVPYLLGAGSWVHTRRMILVEALAGITVFRELVAIVTLGMFILTLGQAGIPAYTTPLFIGWAMYVLGRMGGLTVWALLAAVAATSMTLLFHQA